jgi:NAD(P)-dependent dehydrogenase (short-subunit alcohol dehydrogenase family)
MRLKDRVAVVTGAGNGIGRGIALALAKEGADVAVCALEKDLVSETASMITDLGRKSFSRAFDLGSFDEFRSFVLDSASSLGDVTVAVHNAGVMPVSPVTDLTIEQIDSCLSVNLRAGILLAQLVVPIMERAGGGSIVYMSSVQGHLGYANHSPYAAVKAGLQGLTRSLAIELAQKGIRVNSVSPGTVDSPMLHNYIARSGQDPQVLRAAFDADHPRGTIASIDEVAAAFAFLASPESANITGTDLKCDGGLAVKGGQASAD